MALLQDVARYRCSSHPSLGMPFKISTVDKYQGQVSPPLFPCRRVYTRPYVVTSRRMFLSGARSLIPGVLALRQRQAGGSATCAVRICAWVPQ